MAMIKCRECEKKISSEAETCPYCGIASQKFLDQKENMSLEKSENRSLEKSVDPGPPIIDLGSLGKINLSELPENERNALIAEHSKNMMGIHKKGHDLKLDSDGLKKTLDGMTDTAKSAKENDTSATISHTQTSELGRTEVMIGNTNKANEGKFSNSQTGEKDLTPFYICGGIVAIVIIVALMKN